MIAQRKAHNTNDLPFTQGTSRFLSKTFQTQILFYMCHPTMGFGSTQMTTQQQKKMFCPMTTEWNGEQSKKKNTHINENDNISTAKTIFLFTYGNFISLFLWKSLCDSLWMYLSRLFICHLMAIPKIDIVPQRRMRYLFIWARRRYKSTSQGSRVCVLCLSDRRE